MILRGFKLCIKNFVVGFFDKKITFAAITPTDNPRIIPTHNSRGFSSQRGNRARPPPFFT